MNVRNATEQVVKDEIGRLKSERLPEDSLCWCASCEMDITALTLRFLRPNYYTVYDFESVLKKDESSRIRETIEQSAQRVAQFPKHKTSSPEKPPVDLRLINVNFEEGKAMMGSLRKESELPCFCEQCRGDILAYALNRYPPLYCVERDGCYSLPEGEREAVRQELSSILNRSAEIVTRRPRH